MNLLQFFRWQIIRSNQRELFSEAKEEVVILQRGLIFLRSRLLRLSLSEERIKCANRKAAFLHSLRSISKLSRYSVPDEPCSGNRAGYGIDRHHLHQSLSAANTCFTESRIFCSSRLRLSCASPGALIWSNCGQISLLGLFVQLGECLPAVPDAQ